MARVSFSPNIRSQVDVGEIFVSGLTLADVMKELFSEIPILVSYLLNDDGSVRKHVAIVVDGEPIRDREKLSDPISDDADIFVMQALSGG